ncbi:type IV pilus biogenesis protein PilM [Streptococcus panodentis]|uniref:Fimbrial assembly protein n=1 Tax=Streptococcus panodentis TaxID=1581472 RepID=A0ABS5AUR4_9STRE|nr:pilus assembly protein PilM [Streptococcus panodentis]MBP2620309.1 fimbrial assembly protein [Streptococcus panodentis]
MAKSMFSSKRHRNVEDEQDDVKKDSFLGKLNKPLFSSKGKNSKGRLSIQGVEIKADDRQDDFDDEVQPAAKGSFLTKLNKPLFSKNADIDEGDAAPAKSGRRSLFSKKSGSGVSVPAVRAHAPYTMFGKPIKGNLMAIDFNDEAVYLVVARQKRQELEIIKMASAGLPEGVVLNSEIVDPITLKDVISDLMEEHSITAKYAFFALGNTNIIARSVDVAASVQSDEDIEGLVSYELQQYLDIDPTAYVIQFQEQETGADLAFPGDTETRSLMVYAVPKGVVEQYLNLASSLKLTPYVFDLQSNTFEKWLERVQAINNRAKKLTQQNIGMVHLSKTFIGVYLYSEGKFVTSNYLNRGYSDILHYADDASLLQKLTALASDELDTGLLKQALDEWLADAKSHILNTENFFSGSTGQTIDSFYVFGDQDICWQLSSILKSNMNRDFVSIDSVDYENVLWEGTAEFNAEFIPATAMLIRRAN